MKRIRRIAVLAALATLGTAAPAAAAHPGPAPVTDWIRPVRAHEPTWVSVRWTTGRRICDAALTVRAAGVRIAYPGNTGTYTSFSDGAELRPGHADHTAFRVDPDLDRTALVPLRATLSYNTCGSRAVEQARIYLLHLPVLRD